MFRLCPLEVKVRLFYAGNHFVVFLCSSSACMFSLAETLLKKPQVCRFVAWTPDLPLLPDAWEEMHVFML
jgi:hypothetical protein